MDPSETADNIPFTAQMTLAEQYETFRQIHADETDCSSYSLEKSKSGFPVLLSDGKPLHSRHDPVKESLRTSESALSSQKTNYIFFGAGLGYSLHHLLKQKNIRCFWFESSPCIILNAFRTFDFSEALSEKRLVPINALPSGNEMDTLFKGLRNSDVEFVVHRPTFLEQSEYRKFFQVCEDFFNKKDVNLATLGRFENVWAANFSRNFPVFLHASPVQELFRTVSSPVLICGAGPSLTESIESIKKIRSKVVLIAVDTSLKILNHYGIDPDITVTVDPQPVNREYLEGYSGKSLFVCDLCCSHHALRQIPQERIYIFKSPYPLAKLLYRSMDKIPEDLAFGGSVSTNAYDLAVKMGADKIYLAGMDLSFPGKRAHAAGAVLEERLNFLEKRTFRRELHNYRQLSALPVRYVQGLDGKPVQTNDKLLIFHKWFAGRFQKDAAENGLKIFNATVQGSEIPGTVIGRLTDLLQEEDTSFDPGKINESSAAVKNTEKFRNDLIEFRKDLKSFLELCREGKETAESLYRKLKNSESIADEKIKLNRLDEIDELLLAKSFLTDLLSGVIQKTLQILEENEKSESDSSALLVKKSLLLYSELARASEDYLRLFARTLERVQRQT